MNNINYGYTCKWLQEDLLSYNLLFQNSHHSAVRVFFSPFFQMNLITMKKSKLIEIIPHNIT